MNNQVLLLVNGWAGKDSVLDGLMIFCAKYLIYLVFASVAVCVIYWVLKRDWKSLIYFFMTLVATYVLLRIATLLNFDHRPFMDHHLTQLVSHAPGKSFPSDHTTVTAGIGFGLLFVTQFKKLGIVILLAACVIGFARIFVGVHYPLDIIGGLATGLVGGAVTYGVKRIIETRWRIRDSIASDHAE